MDMQGQQGMQGPGQGQMMGGRMMSMMHPQQPQQQMMGHTHGGMGQGMGQPGMSMQQMQGHAGHHMPGPPQPTAQTPAVQELKLDNISKAKALMPTLREAVSNMFRAGAEAVYANTLVDSASKPADLDTSTFDKSLEEFYSVCDHMEMQLRAAMECISQGEMSNENLSAPLTHVKMEGAVTYPQYVNVVVGQVNYAKDVHDALAEAAQKLLE